jgi:hypothetical protein
MRPFGYRRVAGSDAAPDLVLLRTGVLAWERCCLTSRESGTSGRYVRVAQEFVFEVALGSHG